MHGPGVKLCPGDEWSQPCRQPVTRLSNEEAGLPKVGPQGRPVLTVRLDLQGAWHKALLHVGEKKLQGLEEASNPLKTGN